MTSKEFETEAAKLSECYPQQFAKGRLQTIFYEVKDLDHKWWMQTVKSIILSGKPNTDIGESARNYRNTRRSLQNAEDIIRASEAIREQSTDEGFRRALKLFGAKDLVEAIGKKRIQTEEL